ncbi:isochorismatase [bacterium SCGC AG-212-C10]|nr:isochorismatase [bacterium SCGC AG-212-C10]
MTTDYSEGDALIVVDVQNDFADPAGSLYAKGAEELIPALNDEIRAARKGIAPVFYTQDWHPASTPHFQKDGGPWPVHCVANTRGAEFHPDLLMDGEVVQKGVDGEDGYSGFSTRDPQSGATSSTLLANRLREYGVTHVVVSGLATEYCVLETVLDACRLGFEVTVKRSLIGGVEIQPGDSERALERMRAAGAEIVA